MSSFKPLNNKIYQKSGPVITADYIYWKKYAPPVLVKEFGPIDYIDFSPIEPHYFAVTCSVRVQIYNPITKLVTKNLSRFRENAYGASFRADGKLLCAGGEEKNVKLFDVASKSLLRLFKGHEAPVHRTFFTYDKPQIASFSDDKSVKLWDIPTETCVNSYTNHNDYVRAGAVCKSLPNLVLSGSYDNTVKLYDNRTNTCAIDVNHGSPIESVLFLPTGGIFISAGGTEIKVWDTLAGGKLLGNVSQHHKTITCLRLASDNKRLLSGSLDRHVKVYDLNSFKTVHTLTYPNAIISLGISKNDDTIVAGLVDGLVSISRRETDFKDSTDKDTSKVYNNRASTHAEPDAIVSELVIEKQSKYDMHLRKFQYSKALKVVLRPYICTKTPEITVALLHELVRRQALNRVFSSLELKEIVILLKFFRKNITDYRFVRILLVVINIFIDEFESQIKYMPAMVIEQFQLLNDVLGEECKLGEQLGNVQGVIEMLLSCASVANEEEVDLSAAKQQHNLIPSANAQKNMVFEIS